MTHANPATPYLALKAAMQVLVEAEQVGKLVKVTEATVTYVAIGERHGERKPVSIRGG